MPVAEIVALPSGEGGKPLRLGRMDYVEHGRDILGVELEAVARTVDAGRYAEVVALRGDRRINARPVRPRDAGEL